MSWLTSGPKLELYEKVAAFALFCRGLTLTCDWATGTPVWRMWTTRKKKKVRGSRGNRSAAAGRSGHVGMRLSSVRCHVAPRACVLLQMDGWLGARGACASGKLIAAFNTK